MTAQPATALAPIPTIGLAVPLDPEAPLFGGCQTVAPQATDKVVSQAVVTSPLQGVLHRVDESYQVYGIPVTGGVYQPVTRTSEIWLDRENPLRRAHRITETIGPIPPRLAQASVSDGETWYYYAFENNPEVVYAAPSHYLLAAGPDAQTEIQGVTEVLAERLARGHEGQENWCYLGRQTLPRWGETEVVAFDWYCRDHGGCPADEWYSELWWIQLSEGRLPQYAIIRHRGEDQSELFRLDRLLVWETVPLTQTPEWAFAFTIPPETQLVRRETLVDPTDPSVGPEGTLSRVEFARLTIFTPVLPTSIPAGYHLSHIEVQSDDRYLVIYVRGDDPAYRFTVEELVKAHGCAAYAFPDDQVVELENGRVFLYEVDQEHYLSVCVELTDVDNPPVVLVNGGILLEPEEVLALIQSIEAVKP
jgi:hypothetical protein